MSRERQVTTCVKGLGLIGEVHIAAEAVDLDLPVSEVATNIALSYRRQQQGGASGLVP
jgi:hypothetical protein